MWWLIIGCIQTFVIIPLIVWKWGKGAYCGWICSCGALAETMGDTHRHKMPHGPFWNRLNMIGQVFLLLVSVLLVAVIVRAKRRPVLLVAVNPRAMRSSPRLFSTADSVN